MLLVEFHSEAGNIIVKSHHIYIIACYGTPTSQSNFQLMCLLQQKQLCNVMYGTIKLQWVN